MMNDKEIKQIFTQLQSWHENNIQNLKSISDPEVDIKLESNDPEKPAKVIKKDTDIAKGIRLGAIIAIDIIGKFPLSLNDNN